MLRTLLTADCSEVAVNRELSAGKHAAITASPSSRVLQYMDNVSTSVEHSQPGLRDERKSCRTILSTACIARAA